MRQGTVVCVDRLRRMRSGLLQRNSVVRRKGRGRFAARTARTAVGHGEVSVASAIIDTS